MDYKIKFESKGIGKQAASARNRVLQSQRKAAGTKAGDTAATGRSTISSLKALNSSILKLIKSNQDLSKSLKMMSKGVPVGGRGMPTRAPVGGMGGGSAGFGRIGSSIPILGAAIATLGFTIQKINQVGNAYIERTAQQIGNVGVGGFRYGRGVYTSAQMGAGMKAYGMATGRFAAGVQPEKTALDIGAIYGQSAEETLRTAGQFKRVGANYRRAAAVGAGMGIESELPTLLSGMATIFTDAVKEGVNASDLSKDMAQEISSLAVQTPGKSVEAALNIVKSFQGVQKQLAGGRMGTAQGLFAAKASQQMLMEKLTGKEGVTYRKELEKTGFISKEQSQRMGKIKQGADFQQLLEAAPSAAYPLLRKFTAETSPAALQRQTIAMAKKSFGDTPEGRQRFYDFASTQGWAESQSQLESLMGVGKAPKGVEGRGEKIISERAKGVKESAAGLSVKRMQDKEALLFEFGKSFAKQSIEMERAMMDLAKKAAPYAIDGMNAVGDAAKSLSSAINTISKVLKKDSQPSLFNTAFSYASEFMSRF